MTHRPGSGRLNRYAAGLFLAALLWSACTTDTAIGPGPVAAVRIVPDTLKMVAGSVDTAHGFALDASGALLASRPVSWSVVDPNIASVTAGGVVTAHVIGNTQIIASLDNFADTSVVRVLPPPTILFNPDTLKFTGVAGSGALPTQTTAVLNNGGGSLDNLSVASVTYSAGATGWATAGLDQISAPAVLTVSATSTGIAVGTYTAKVAISDPAATNDPDTLIVTMTLAAGAPASITVNTGDGQTATVNTNVTTAPSAKVLDAFGNGVAGVSVTFAVTAGAGSVTGGTATTNASGVATVGSWKLGTAMGNNTLRATTAALPGGQALFSATGSPGAATQLSKNGGDAQSVTAGSPVAVAPSALVRDQFNNPVQGVSVTFAVASGGGAVAGGAATTNTAGVAAPTSWTLGTVVGANTLTATSAGLTGSPLTFTATGTAGAATDLIANSATTLTGTAGSPVATPPSVKVTDSNGNGVAGITVTFAVTGGGGSLSGTATKVTSAAGVATVTGWTLGTTAGANTLSASASGLTGSPLVFTATGAAGAATTIALAGGNNQSGTVGTALGTALTVKVSDANGNGVTGVTVNWAATGGGSVTASSATNAAGIASATRTLGNTAGPQGATATSAGLTGSPVTFTFTASAGAASQIAANTGTGQSGQVGSTLGTPPSVKVTDAFGNPVGGVSVTFATAAGNGSITGASQTTLASGIATVGSWTLGSTAKTDTLTATSAGLTGSPVRFTAIATAGAAANIALAGGDAQTGTAGAALPVAYTVLITDGSGNPVAGTTVTWAVGGGGSITPTSVSNAAGIASATRTLGTVAGPQTATATAAGLTGSPVSFSATATPAAAANVAANAGTGQNATVGTALAVNPAVLVTDQFGNPVSGVTITFAVTANNGSLTGASASTNASGIATVGSWTLGSGAKTDTLRATGTGLTGSPVLFTAVATAGAATQIAINAGNGQTAVAGANVGTNPSVLVRDALNNPVSGVAVTFAVASGGGSVTGGSATTNASGIASVGSWTLGTTAGANSLTATSAGLTGSPLTFTATGTAGAATTLVANSATTLAGTVGQAVTPAPSVKVTDTNGNGVAGVSVTFAVTGGGGSITGTATKSTDAAGVATVTAWNLGAVTGANTLTATSAGLTGSPVTFSATGNPGGATTIALVSGNGQTGTVGAALGTVLTVKVTDNLSNPVPGFTVAWSTPSGGTITPSSITDASGNATATWTLGNTAGAQSASASASGLTGSPVAFTATANPGAATQIALVAGDAQTATVNTAVAIAPSVKVSDAFGNGVPGVGVTFAPASGGGSVTGGSASTNASGIATVGSWTLGTLAGANSLTATSGGLAGSPVTFNATGTAGAASQIAVNLGDGQTATAGSAVAVAPSVIVRDALNNPVGGVAVTFAVTGGGGGVTGAGTTTNASGIATVGSWTLGTTAGANTMTASSGGLAGSPVTFTATGTAGAPANLAIIQGNGQTGTAGVALGTALIVLVTDANNNPVNAASVSFAPSGNGSVPVSPVATGVNGQASTSWTLATAAGANTLAASVLGVTPVNFSATGLAGGATTVALNGGNGQSATVNTSVGTPPSVVVTDSFGNPVSGFAVTFTPGAGSVTGGSTTTNGSGIATVGSWTLGTTSGSQTLSATAAGLGGSPVTFTATATPGAPNQIAVNAGNGQTAAVASAVAIAPSVLITDQFGNPVGAGVPVTFAADGTNGSSATGTAPSTNASGVATVGSWTLGTLVTTYSLTATSGGLTGSPVTFTATSTPGTPDAGTSTLSVTAPSITASGGGSTTTVTATAKDQFGNLVPGAAIVFFSSGSGNSFVPGSGTANASGQVSVSYSSTVAESKTLSATADGLGIAQSQLVTVNPGAVSAALSSIGASPGSITASSGSSTSTITVTARDAFSNLITGAAVVLGSSGSGNTIGQPGAATNGSGQTTGTLSSTKAEGKTVSATINGTAITPTASVTVVAAAAATLVMTNAGTMNNQVATVNTNVAVAPSVTVTDAFGNPVSGFSVTFTPGVNTGTNGGVNGGAAGSTAVVATNASGIAGVSSWRLGTAASGSTNNFLTTSSALPFVQFLARATTGAPSIVSRNAGNAQTARVGTNVATAPSVLVTDAFGNPVSGSTVTWAVTGGGGSVGGSTSLTNASGIATVASWTLSNG
ncbi:MAG TPA: Ig-like domain-containing protein, partial [Gemmatimonadales bacterium]|nr:Ig-like domain-containing protein [Gemmatimonadales bacterium]